MPDKIVKPLDALANAQKAQQKQASQKAPSLMGQLAGLVKGVPGGLYKMASDTGGGVKEFLQNLTAIKGVTPWDRTYQSTGSMRHQWQQALEHYVPMINQMGSSIYRSSGRVANLAAGLNPLSDVKLKDTAYAQAIRDGTILPTIVEDVGNAALVGGAAAKAASAGAAAAEGAGMARTAGALGKAADVIREGTGLAHNISNTPVLPFRLALKAANKGLALGAEDATGALAGRGLLTQALEDRSPKINEQLTKVRGLVKDRAQVTDMRGKFVDGRASEVMAAKPIALDFKGAMDALKAGGMDDLDTQHATAMVKAGLVPVLQRIENMPGGEQLRQMALNDAFGVEQRPSPAAIAKALDWHANGPPAPVEEAWGRVSRQLGRVQEMKLKGEGMKAPLNPEQLLHEPMQSRIDRAVNPLDAGIETLKKRAEKAAKQAQRADRLSGRTKDYGTVTPKRTAITAESIGSNLERLRSSLEDMTDHDAFHKAKQIKDYEGSRRTVLSRTMLADAEMAGRLGEMKGGRNLLARQAGRAADEASNRVINAQLERDLLESALKQGPSESAPGMYQPALKTAERLRMSLLEKATAIEEQFPLAARRLRREAEAIPQTMEALQAEGVRPEYMPGGYEDPVRGHGTGLPKRMQEQALGAERAKKEGNLLHSFSRVGEQLTRDVAKMEQNKTIAGVREQYGTTFKKLAEAEAKDLPAGSPELIDLQARLKGNFDGHDIAAEMKRRGMVPIDQIPEQAVNAETVFMPERLAKEYRRMTEKPIPGPALKAYDRTTRAWKTLNLPLNPGWQIGNAIGNPIMGMLGTGTPKTWFEEFRKVPEILRKEAETGEPQVPPRLHGISSALDELKIVGDTDAAPKGPLGRLIQKSYDMNESMDTRNRIATYNTFLRQGYDEATALKMALKVGGDFSNLSTIERNVVKRALPFYPWQKHITRLSADLLTKHPGRVATALHFANLMRGDASDPANLVDPNDFRSGMAKLGKNWFLPIGNINPFDSALRSPFTSPQAALGALNPVIKAGAYALADVNLQKGRMNTRPKGTGNLDASGRQVLGPASLGEDLYYLSQQAPLTRLGFALAKPAHARYDTGAEIKRGRKPVKTEGGKTQQITRNLGLPLPIFIDEQRMKNTKARQAADLRAALKKKRSS